MKISFNNSSVIAKAVKVKQNKSYTDKHYPYLTLITQSRGEPTWHFRKKVNNKLYSEALGKYALLTLVEAQTKVSETLNLLNSGLHPKLEKQKKLNALAVAETQLITFREITEQYFTFANLKDDRCSKLLVENYLYPLNGLTLQQINKQYISSILQPILKSGKKSTYNRSKAVLSAIINYGLKHLDIDAKNHCNIFPKAKIDPKDRVLSQTEVDKYLLTARQWLNDYNDCKFGVFFLLLYYTGTRGGELKKLKWNDISESDANNAFMTIQSENSKSGYRVTKPIVPNVLLYLKRLKDKCDKNNPYVFEGKHKQYLQDFRKPWKRFLTAADLPFGITPHCLKHTFATRLMEAGVPFKVIASFTGNRDFQTLFKHYLTVSTKSQDKALDALNEYDKKDRPKEVQKIFDIRNQIDNMHLEIIENSKSMIERLTRIESQGGEMSHPFEKTYRGTDIQNIPKEPLKSKNDSYVDNSNSLQQSLAKPREKLQETPNKRSFDFEI